MNRPSSPALQADKTITSYFLVCEKKFAPRARGNLSPLEIGVTAPAHRARMWDGFEPRAASFERDDFAEGASSASKATAASSRLPSDKIPRGGR